MEGKLQISKFKIIFLGEQSIGKTSIINRFNDENFNGDVSSTVGIDFIAKTMHLMNNKIIRLQLWDTAGQERFRSLIPGYIRDANVAVIVFDVTNKNSYYYV